MSRRPSALTQSSCPLRVKHTAWHRPLLGKLQKMEDLDSTLKDLTPLLSKYMDASGSLDPSRAPPDITDLLERLKGFQQRQQQANSAPVITPKPGFVVKALDASGQKFFINVCTSEHVVSPSLWQQHQGDDTFRERIEEAVKVAPGKDSELLRFPMSLGEPRQDKDRNGDVCTVLDVTFSPQAVDMAEQSRPLKSFLVELALAWAARAHGLHLGGFGQWKLPKMRYKGASVVTQELRLERNVPRIEETEEPSVSRAVLQEVLSKKSQEIGARLQQGSSASKRSNTAEKAPGPLPNASQAKQPQLAAQVGPPSKHPAREAGGGSPSKASGAPSSSASSGPPELAVPREERAPALKTAAVAPIAQPSKPPIKAAEVKCKALQHSVEFQGRPVTSVIVTVDLSGCDSDTLSSSGDIGAPNVAVRRDQVVVKVHGRAPLHIELPFGVDARQGKARYMTSKRRISLELPYKSYTSFTQEGSCRKLPLVDDFGFPDSYFMQLET